MPFAVSVVCASFCSRVLEEHSPGKFAAVWERSVCLCVLCLSYEMILASVHAFIRSNRTPLSGWRLAVIAGCAALHLFSHAQANLPQLSKRFHAGVWGHFTCLLYASFPGLGKYSCTFCTPEYWIKPCRLIWKSEQAVNPSAASKRVRHMEPTRIGGVSRVVAPLHQLTNRRGVFCTRTQKFWPVVFSR